MNLFEFIFVWRIPAPVLNFLLYGTTAKFVCIFNLQVCFGNSVPHVTCSKFWQEALYDSSFLETTYVYKRKYSTYILSVRAKYFLHLQGFGKWECRLEITISWGDDEMVLSTSSLESEISSSTCSRLLVKNFFPF